MSASPKPNDGSSSRSQARGARVGGAHDEIARLRAELAARDRLIEQHQTGQAQERTIFERASAAAKIGVWACSLPDQTLHWTDQVFEMFELPRGAAPDREQVLQFYTRDSLDRLSRLRAEAIAERKGFHLDAEIVTARGHRRWIRLTASVECEAGVAVRIFGMKQDITEEKILFEHTRHLAEFDGLTGLPNRSSFQARLADLDGPTVFGALLLVDLDGFKQINDTFGHALGDECLRVAAARLNAVCPDPDFVARIGGDEFAVLLDAGRSPKHIGRAAERIVEAMRRPMACRDLSFEIGASVGVARIAGGAPSELFTSADAALYAAKAAGRNTFRAFDLVS